MDLQAVRDQMAIERVLRRYCSGTADMERLADAMAHGELRLSGNARLVEDAERRGKRCLELDGVAMSPEDVDGCAAWLQGMALAEGMGWI